MNELILKCSSLICECAVAVRYHRIYFWGEFALNINGPLMVLTQKMTQLAYSVHDGTHALLVSLSLRVSVALTLS